LNTPFFNGSLAYIILLVIAVYLYKYLPPDKEIIERLLICKFFSFLLSIAIIFLTNTNPNMIFTRKIANYTLQSIETEYEDEKGYVGSYKSSKKMYPISKSIENYTIENDNIYILSNTHSITKGYGLINGYKLMNVKLSWIEKYILSGFQYLFELLISTWLNQILAIFFFYFEYKHRLTVKLGIRNSLNRKY
jgi:hypothetical protein